MIYRIFQIWLGDKCLQTLDGARNDKYATVFADEQN